MDYDMALGKLLGLENKIDSMIESGHLREITPLTSDMEKMYRQYKTTLSQDMQSHFQDCIYQYDRLLEQYQLAGGTIGGGEIGFKYNR
jgi:hypothetical protein